MPRSTPTDISRLAGNDGPGGTTTMLFGLYNSTRFSHRAPTTGDAASADLPAWIVLHQPILFLPSCPATVPDIAGHKTAGGCGATISWSLKVITDTDGQTLVEQAGGDHLPIIR